MAEKVKRSEAKTESNGSSKKAHESESLFESLCDRCSDAFAEGSVGSTLTAYSKEESAFDTSVIVTAVRRSEQGHGILRRFKRAVAKSFEESLFMGMLERFRRAALVCSLRTFGVFFMTFGIYTSLIYLIKKYAMFADEAAVSDLFCGIVMIILALPLLFSSKSVSSAIGNSFFLKPVLADALGIIPDKLSGKSLPLADMASWGVIAGIAIGMLTYFVSPIVFVTAIFIVAFVSVLLTFPEAGVTLVFITAPFLSLSPHPSLILAVITLLSTAGFAIKYLRGKRIIVFGPAEAAVAAFMLLTLAGGLFIPGGGDSSTALLRSALMLIYFLIVNTVNTRRRLITCVSLLVASTTVVSFAGVAEYLLGKAVYNWLDVEMFADIAGRSTSFFENPNTLGYFIVLAFPFALAVFALGKNKRERFIAGFCALSMLLCMVFTWSRGAWIGMAVSSMLFLLVLTPRSIAVLPAAAAVGSLFCMLFPNTLGARVDSIASLSDTANYYRVRIWNGVCRLIGENAAGGIGVGEEIFSRAYIRVASPEVWNASHAHSLWLQTLTELGIPGLLLLLLAMFLIIQKSAECIKLCRDKKLALFCSAGMCGVFAGIVSGAFDFIWYNNTVFLVFWAVAGLASAAAEIRKLEFRNLNTESTLTHSDEKAVDLMLYLGRGN